MWTCKDRHTTFTYHRGFDMNFDLSRFEQTFSISDSSINFCKHIKMLLMIFACYTNWKFFEQPIKVMNSRPEILCIVRKIFISMKFNTYYFEPSSAKIDIHNTSKNLPQFKLSNYDFLLKKCLSFNPDKFRSNILVKWDRYCTWAIAEISFVFSRLSN